jgi:hypothetical protein
MRAQGGGEGRERGRVERKEVRWAWMGAKGFGMRGLGLGFGSDVPAELLSHGNWNWEGMAMAVRSRHENRMGKSRTVRVPFLFFPDRFRIGRTNPKTDGNGKTDTGFETVYDVSRPFLSHFQAGSVRLIWVRKVGKPAGKIWSGQKTVQSKKQPSVKTGPFQIPILPGLFPSLMARKKNLAPSAWKKAERASKKQLLDLTRPSGGGRAAGHGARRNGLATA